MTTIIKTAKQSRETRHVEGNQFLCGDCGKVKPVGTSGGTGYGFFSRDDDAKPICYECCGVRETADMKQHGRATLYLTVERLSGKWGDAKVTNWPGTLSLRGGVKVGRHNMAGTPAPRGNVAPRQKAISGNPHIRPLARGSRAAAIPLARLSAVAVLAAPTACHPRIQPATNGRPERQGHSAFPRSGHDRPGLVLRVGPANS